MEPRDAAPGSRVALPGFVSTAVLTSSDGLFGDNVEETRISEAPVPRAQDAADYKPLYERLQELKEKKDSEWREKNNPFAPPKALDDEEIQFIRDLEEREAASQQRRKEQHNEDLAGFLLAKQQASKSAASSSKSAGATTATPNRPLISAVLSNDARQKVLATQSTTPAVVVRAKRKAPAKEKTAASTKKAKAAGGGAGAGESSASGKAPPSQAPSLGLVAYGSDSDSDGQ